MPLPIHNSNLTCLFQKQRLDRVRQKLSKLSDSEKLEFMKLKAERKAQKNKSINDTIP